MTAQKLYSTLKFLDVLDTQLALQNHLEAIRDALNNLVNAPAQPQHQSALANALAAFTAAATKLGSAISESQAVLICEMGGERFFDPSIADNVKASISSNAMTPSVARDFVQELTSRRSAFLGTVRSTRQGLQTLGITEVGVEPGSADMAFLIPRELFNNHLGAFAKELIFISHLLQHFSEALTGNAEPVRLEELSSSLPTVGLGANLAVIEMIAKIVNKFLEAWDKIQKIRKIRTELTEMGLKGAAVDELTDQITTTVDEVVEESTEIVLVRYQGDTGRKNELRNAVEQDTRRLFGQIERGLRIEFRAEPERKGEDGNQQALVDLANLSREIKFPQIANEPVLLGSGEILEGEIEVVRHTKKTTTNKTTSSKKETRKESKQETKEPS